VKSIEKKKGVLKWKIDRRNRPGPLHKSKKPQKIRRGLILPISKKMVFRTILATSVYLLPKKKKKKGLQSKKRSLPSFATTMNNLQCYEKAGASRE